MSTHTKTIVLALVTAALLAGCATQGGLSQAASTVATPTGSAGAILLPAAVRAEVDAAGGLKPCATEDSTSCYWDAALQGNGHGTSFIDWHGVLYR